MAGAERPDCGRPSRATRSLLLEIADLLAGRRPDGSWDNLWEANAAVNCLDSSDRPTPEQVEAEAADLTDVSPIFGPVIAWSGLQCSYWPVAADPIPLAVATGAPPIVVIGTTRDPATPFVWSERMAATLASGVLLVARRRWAHRVRREPVHRSGSERVPARGEGAGRQDVLRRVDGLRLHSYAFAVAPAASAGLTPESFNFDDGVWFVAKLYGWVSISSSVISPASTLRFHS